jgi:hypothetical protein
VFAQLVHNGVLDDAGNWIDESTTVVSVGDTVGRGHQDRDVLEFIKEMSTEHRWLQQLGNHEIMQLRDDWRYVVDGDGIGFGSLAAREAALERGSELGDWLRELPPIRIVGDNIFIHAGLSDELNVGRTPEDMHDELRTFLDVSQPRVVYNDLIWSRDLIRDAHAGVPGTCEHVERIIAGLPGTSRIWLGHTTVQSLAGSSQTEPLVFCDGQLYGIDVGISRWMSANPVNIRAEVDVAGRTINFETLRTPIAGAGQPLGPGPLETPYPEGYMQAMQSDTPPPPPALAGGWSGMLLAGAVAALGMVAVGVAGKWRSLDRKRELTGGTWRTALQERKYSVIAAENGAEDL